MQKISLEQACSYCSLLHELTWTLDAKSRKHQVGVGNDLMTTSGISEASTDLFVHDSERFLTN